MSINLRGIERIEKAFAGRAWGMEGGGFCVKERGGKSKGEIFE